MDEMRIPQLVKWLDLQIFKWRLKRNIRRDYREKMDPETYRLLRGDKPHTQPPGIRSLREDLDIIRVPGQDTEYLGFKDEEELGKMVNRVDLTNPKIRLWFRDWKVLDASKRGLQELLNDQFDDRFNLSGEEPWDDGHGDSWPPTY